MTKIVNWSNLYSKDGSLLKKAPLADYNIEETEKLLDDLTKQVEENPDDELLKVYLNNTTKWLYHLYQLYGNPHEKKIMDYIKSVANNDVTEEQVTTALGALSKELNKDEQQGDSKPNNG